MRSSAKHIIPAAVALFLAACGGGGGSSSAPLPPVETIASLPVQLSASNASIQLVEGGSENADFTFTASYTGTSKQAIIPSFQFDESLFAQQGDIQPSGTGYVLHLRTKPNLGGGDHAGQVKFRLCQDSACAVVYPASTQTVNYSVKVAMKDWGTFQRNSAHNAYVHVTLDPTKFSQSWSWSRPAGDTEPVGGINTVATGGGMVYVSKDIYFGQADVFALKEADGSQAWHYALGYSASEGPPAFSNGTVYFSTTTSGEKSRITALDAATGAYKFLMPYASQWTAYLAPTIQGNSVLHTSSSVSNYSTVDGTLNWMKPASAYDVTTPAADDTYVYQYGSAGGTGTLSVFNLADGTPVASINDPFFPGSPGYSEFAAPMLGSNHNVIAFSGGGFSGRAASNSEQYQSRVLVNYDVSKKAIAWRTSAAYLTHPALGNGVMYAATPMQLDAINEADGQVMWSWPRPSTDTGFHRNIVLTDNLVFISTDRAVYAIDLKSHLPVWSYTQGGGNLAISGSGILYITTGATGSDGKLVAIKLM